MEEETHGGTIMRTAVFEAWRDAISLEMERKVPMFTLSSRRSAGEWPRLLKYRHKRTNGAEWWLLFRPLDEQFDVYAGWCKRRSPSFALLSQVITGALPKGSKGDGLLLPTSVMAGRSGATFWSFWNPSDDVVADPPRFAAEFVQHCAKPIARPEADGIVQDAVTSAIDEIVAYCIPYLEKNSSL
jgi:hypothetical protein